MSIAMKELTKAEEQVMLHLWELEQAFLKDIVEHYPEPRPAYTTIQTVVRVLTKKEFIGFETFGKTNRYYPLISKSNYFRGHLKGMVHNFFNGSMSNFASFFTEDKDLSKSELEELKQMIEEKITKINNNEH